MAQRLLSSVTRIQLVTCHLIKDPDATSLCCAYAAVWIWTPSPVHSGIEAIMPLPGLIIPFLHQGPFLDCHVWLTQSAATQMGVHPLPWKPSCPRLHNSRALLGSADGFVRLSLNVIVGKIKWRVRNHSEGVPTWSPAEMTEQTESEFLSFFCRAL